MGDDHPSGFRKLTQPFQRTPSPRRDRRGLGPLVASANRDAEMGSLHQAHLSRIVEPDQEVPLAAWPVEDQPVGRTDLEVPGVNLVGSAPVGIRRPLYGDAESPKCGAVVAAATLPASSV
jgi:hypothetical protein